MNSETSHFALVIHGGAGVIERDQLSAAEEQAIRADLEAALEAGNVVLAAGGSALDAAQAAVVCCMAWPAEMAPKALT